MKMTNVLLAVLWGFSCVHSQILLQPFDIVNGIADNTQGATIASKCTTRTSAMRLLLVMYLTMTVLASEKSHNSVPMFLNILRRVTTSTLGVVRSGFNVLDATVSNIMNSAMSITDRIRKLLEEFRRYMVTGIPELGLPILDPLTIRRIDMNITHKELTLQGYVEDVSVRHLSKFKLDDISYNIVGSTLILNITFPILNIDGIYDIKVGVGKMFSIFGKGPFWVELYRLSIETVSKIKVNPLSYPPFSVESMAVTPKLKGLDNHFSGLMDNKETEETFNKAITRMAPTALDTIWPEIEPKVSKILVAIINQKLKDFRVTRVVGRMFDMFKLNFNQDKIEVSNIR